jgi:hypothetical protein
MQQIGAAINLQAKPDNHRERMAAVSKSIMMLLTLKPKEDVSRELAATYHVAVKDETPETISQAVMNFIQGKAQDQNLAFCPSPPQLARECRRVATPKEAFDRVWKATDATQAILEAPDTVRDREIAADREKTPDERLNAINRIRKKFGQEPFNPYAEVKSHGTPTTGGIRDYSKAQIGDTSRLAATLETKAVSNG